MRCLGETSLLSSSYAAFSSWFLYWKAPIMLLNSLLWLFAFLKMFDDYNATCIAENIVKNLSSWFLHLWSAFAWFQLLSSLPIGFKCVMTDPCLVSSIVMNWRKTSFGGHWNIAKLRSEPSTCCCSFVFRYRKRGTHFTQSFCIAKLPMQNISHVFCRYLYDASPYFNLVVFENSMG